MGETPNETVRELYPVQDGEAAADAWLSGVVLEFATIAGLFSLLFGLFFLLQALRDMPA